MSGEPDPLYVRARAVLLDAVDALGVHGDAVVLVGAQAIYLHTGDAQLAVPEYTTDADLVISPASLTDHRWMSCLWAEASSHVGTLAPGSAKMASTSISWCLRLLPGPAGVARRSARTVGASPAGRGDSKVR